MLPIYVTKLFAKLNENTFKETIKCQTKLLTGNFLLLQIHLL